MWFPSAIWRTVISLYTVHVDARLFWDWGVPRIPKRSRNFSNQPFGQGAVSIRKTVLPGMAIPMLKIRRPNGRLIFNMEKPYLDKTVFILRRGPGCNYCIKICNEVSQREKN